MDYTSAVPSANGKPQAGIGAFDAAEAAPEYAPVPAGAYSARVLRGEYCSTRAGSEAYRLRLEITEGEQTGKTLIRTWTFGPRALPFTKRDLAPFGLTTSEKLLSPFPEPGREYSVRIVVAVQRGDDGIERNDIKRIDVLRVSESPAAGSRRAGGTKRVCRERLPVQGRRACDGRADLAPRRRGLPTLRRKGRRAAQDDVPVRHMADGTGRTFLAPLCLPH
jgi:hypothetical protein